MYSGLTITCKSDEFSVFTPPSGETCYSWANDFVMSFGGYLDNPNSTDACRYCQYSVGDEFYTPLNMNYSDRWRNVFILFAFFGECGSNTSGVFILKKDVLVFNVLATIGENILCL